RRIVSALLRALAHAHSRGLIHLDIKPGNVLLGSRDDPRPNLKLTDFGLVHALDRQQPCSSGASPHGTVEQARGTPWYMAPEQLCGHWRDYGPWTDLYALGILAWELVCGARPYDGNSARSIGRQHLEQPLPRLKAIFDVPPDLHSWLEGMLDKQPSRRFQRAGDALQAFLALGDPLEPVTVIRRMPVAPEEPDTVVGPAPKPPPKVKKVHDDAITRSLDGSPPKNALLEPAIDLRSRSLLRTPDPGCPQEEPPPPPGLAGAGLGLFHLRRIPFIGRQREREQLWSALREVYSSGQPRAIVLRGPAGLGQSRLASWVCERAHEAGVANYLKASHDSEGRPDSGLPRMFADHFRSVGLRRWSIKLRLGKLLARLGIHDVATLEEACDFLMLASPMHADEKRVSQYRARPGDRRRLMSKLLQHLSRDRLVVVWLDDAHYGEEGVEFVRHTLEQASGDTCPVLFVLTVCDESLGERPQTDAQLA
ncbi:MAG: protein kinase domain-containing protein, partial [Nannocystaceae bacterium]